ncbi:D-alanyl-D-alanine carboxypeptidase family protein [Streptomyces sp. TS71-3]|uniref:D-alanyl-D-alanine carboxypeptidase family protein n=1 Tax=Streptomyces sp. TS71-3 TaxID=2733862 RepID=UPI001B23D7B3|nr:serine hydrolase [Streptomyces sp. TS71-3]GHJ39202.1 D-alanyl-D-alanine carboxypeptidase [Streptomyces sp. TS71-3]
MALRSRPCRRTARAAALAASALLLLPGPAASALARSSHPTEPDPPRPRPAPPQTLLDRPGTQVRRMAGAPALPESVSSTSWLVADAVSGEVLAAHGAHRKLPPASTLKSLFALTVLPQLKATTRHRVTQKDLLGVGEGSSLVGVEPGQTYRVDDLWRGVFLRSGNDAVHVLSSMVGGERAAVRQMQAKAVELGARDTHVVTPDGYDERGQVSSAYDLAVFGRAGLADRQFARYCSTGFARFPDRKGSFSIQNTNRLLTGADGVGHYQGLIGVKNGYTTNAGNTLIAAAHRGSRTILVTVMHPESGEGHAVYSEARSLLNWGFAAAGEVRPVGSLGKLPQHQAPHRVVRARAQHPVLAAKPLFSLGTLISAGAAAVLMAGWGWLALRPRSRSSS